jgi:Beta-lactamase enzyme family/ORF 12 gene product N-terminal
MRLRSALAVMGAAAVAVTAACGGAPGRVASAATPVTSAGSAGGSLAWALPRSAAGRQLGWLLSAAPKAPLPTSEIEQHFDKTFLAAAPPAKINEVLAEVPSKAPWRLVTLDAGTAGNALLAAVMTGATRLTLEIAADSDGLIGGARFALEPPLPPGPASWAALDAAARSLAPDVGFEAATIGADGHCDPIRTLAPAAARPLASMFKLYVLGAVADEVQAGRLSWGQTVALSAGLRSIPSGSLQIEPAGARYTVAQLADLMISSSDNTAADELASLAGRPAVEAQVRLTSAHAGLDIPFLRTRELAALKYDDYPRYADAYLAASPSARLGYLHAVVDRLPLSAIEPAAAALASPRDIGTIEWFASPADLCAQFARLYRDAGHAGLSPVSTAMSFNDGGIGLPSSAWPLVWFKGGSEPGVLTLGYLARSAGGQVVVAVLELSDPRNTITASAELRALSIMHAAFALAG